MYMPCQRGIVDEDTVIANNAIVTNMHIGHQQIVIAHSGLTAILYSAAMDSHTLADNVVITND